MKGRTKGQHTWALAAASRPARECLCSSKACSFSYSSFRRSCWKNWKSCSWGILGRRGPLGRLYNTQHTVARGVVGCNYQGGVSQKLPAGMPRCICFLDGNITVYHIIKYLGMTHNVGSSTLLCTTRLIVKCNMSATMDSVTF